MLAEPRRVGPAAAALRRLEAVAARDGTRFAELTKRGVGKDLAAAVGRERRTARGDLSNVARPYAVALAERSASARSVFRHSLAR